VDYIPREPYLEENRAEGIADKPRTAVRLCRLSEFQAISVVLTMSLPYAVQTGLFHGARHQANRRSQVGRLAAMRARQPGDAIQEARHLLRFIRNHYLAPRPRDTDHLIDGLLLVREKIDPTDVKNAVKAVCSERQRLGRPQEEIDRLVEEKVIY